MVTIEIDEHRLTATVRGLHRVLALRRRIVVPLEDVRGATADPGIRLEPMSLRRPGTNVPGVVVAGTYVKDGEATFWDVRDRANAVVIELEGHPFRRLVVEVARPREVVDRIEAAIAVHRGAAAR